VKTVNMHEAKTHLSRLVEEAIRGEGFVIARAGKPLVKVTAVDAPSGPTSRIGFLPGLRFPEDFDNLGREEITGLFEGDL
jgi:antitoxin (DNA-binding transcriptional repressor) of toxin-antitoxin stability system